MLPGSEILIVLNHNNLTRMLTSSMAGLMQHIQFTIRRASGNSTTPSADVSIVDASDHPSSDHERQQDPPADSTIDLLLPMACEALVLVTQCLISLTLLAEPEQSHAPAARAGLRIIRNDVTEHLRDPTLRIVELLVGAYSRCYRRE